MLILLEFLFFNFLRAVKLTQIYKKATIKKQNKTKKKAMKTKIISKFKE